MSDVEKFMVDERRGRCGRDCLDGVIWAKETSGVLNKRRHKARADVGQESGRGRWRCPLAARGRGRGREREREVVEERKERLEL